jgi:hypothetical protein
LSFSHLPKIWSAAAFVLDEFEASPRHKEAADYLGLSLDACS